MTRPRVLVADTGPIIAFARIQQLDLLHQVVGALLIPPAVYDELVVQGQGRPGADEVERGDWIHQREIADRVFLDQLPHDLHSGEREAITLAHDLNALLLIDERRGRRSAQGLGLTVVRSLRILADAKQRGIIEVVRPLVENLLANRYWIEEDVINSFLDEMGEA
jgi:uncharacterized protein